MPEFVLVVALLVKSDFNKTQCEAALAEAKTTATQVVSRIKSKYGEDVVLKMRCVSK